MTFGSVAQFVLGLLLVGFMTGCSGDVKDLSRCPKIPINLEIGADPLLNLNAVGQSMPVELQVFFLNEVLKFETLDFQTVWRDADQELGDTLVARTSVTAYPGRDQVAPLQAPPQTAFVALVGIFRHPHDQDWRALVDVREAGKACGDSDQPVSIRVRMQDNRLISQ